MSESKNALDRDSVGIELVLNKGSVVLEQWMGPTNEVADLNVVNAARQSFGKTSVGMGASEKGLINFLARERHGTPFEMVQFLFQVKCPIFVAREWMRHRIGSYSEFSSRYSKMNTDFYVPNHEQIRTQKGKPGYYVFEAMSEDEASAVWYSMFECSQNSWDKYEELLDSGVAKEVARMVLPVNMYTSFTWSVNLRSLFNFVSLRSHETALWEIQQYSKAIEKLIKPIVPCAYECFEKNGRKAP